VAMYIGLAWEGMRSSGPSRNASEVHPSGESANPKGGLGAQPVE
jgi:hypothetical protein